MARDDLAIGASGTASWERCCLGLPALVVSMGENQRAIAESLDAHGLTSFLNHYLTPMTDAILSHQGTVDKYMADGIMAFWNAPLDDPQHREHACRAALAMRSELARLNTQWRAEAVEAGQIFKEVRAGIGLNTGPCVVGNLGSDQRFDYSVLGDWQRRLAA